MTEAFSSDSVELIDVSLQRPVTSSTVVFSGAVWNVRRDNVDLGRAGLVTREVIDHPGAVGVLALDAHGRVPLICQYRHPVQLRMWELPAGLLDVSGESAHQAAQRELAEEADLRATTWHTLIDWVLSPGGSSEAFRCYLARDLTDVPLEERHQRVDEEMDLSVHWFPLDEIRSAILAGHLHSPSLIVPVFAACAARDAHWQTLRPADEGWSLRPTSARA
ncbi:MAG: NUDIX domain-containing protein [Actinomycetota bacterium]